MDVILWRSSRHRRPVPRWEVGEDVEKRKGLPCRNPQEFFTVSDSGQQLGHVSIAHKYKHWPPPHVRLNCWRAESVWFTILSLIAVISH